MNTRHIPHLIVALAFTATIVIAPSRLFAVDFVHQVMPILKKHCGTCHTGEHKEGGLSMNTRGQLLAGGESGKVVIPGDASKSHLLERVRSNDDDLRMPPEGPRPTNVELSILEKWIREGVTWESGVTLGSNAWEPPLKPRHVQLPPAQNGRDHPIDRLLDAGLRQRQAEPPPNISDAQFYRRVSLDAVGLLPTPEELQAFVDNPAADKREQLVKQLLSNDVAYADHWLTTWNDLLRNDYTGTGFITGGRTQITAWLYRALKTNKPFDEFVRELISPTSESAGFINGIKWRGEVNASQTRDIQFAQNIAQVFLGINIKCASCHNSFIDRWTLSEAYNLAAIYSDKPLELNRCDKPTGVMATPKWLFPELGDVDPNAPKQERLKQLADLMTHPDNGRFTRTLVNRIWHRLMGRGIVHPVDAMHTKPWNEDLLDYLAVRFAQDGYDLRKFIEFVMNSKAYQSRAVLLEAEPGDDYVYAGPIAKRMTAEQLLDSIWQVTRTHPTTPAAQVDRTPPPQPNKVVRSSDAKLKDTPVTAKWIWYPGTVLPKIQLRRTVALESKPEIARLMATCDNAFSMKINGVSAAASREWTKPVYCDVSQFLKTGENLIEVDAEMFGGAAGFICQFAILDGEKTIVIESDKTWHSRPAGGEWKSAVELKAHGDGPWGARLNPKAPASKGNAPPVRAALVKNDFLMRSLGRPHRDQVVTTRPSELTTLQAIDLANGDILAGYLGRGANQLVNEGMSTNELIDHLYRFSLSRGPTEGEHRLLSDMVKDGRDPVVVEDVLWMIFMLPEFQIVQ